MSDVIAIEGKEYFSSRRASEISGYKQDYIGQLARVGSIEAQRIGGLWYVNMDSLESYKKKSENQTPVPPRKQEVDQDTLISFEGRDYISSGRASKITGYNADYVSQLARSDKILSKQVGNRWYLDREGLIAHKREKDALLAAVQVESVGLRINTKETSTLQDLSYAGAGPFLTYTREEKDLIPTLSGPRGALADEEGEETYYVPIRVSRAEPALPRVDVSQAGKIVKKNRSRTSGKTLFYGALATGALTIVIVLSFGFSSIKDDSIYALRSFRETAAAGASLLGASDILTTISDTLEELLVPELIYRRPD